MPAGGGSGYGDSGYGGDSEAEHALEGGAFIAPPEDDADDAANKVVKLVGSSVRFLREACENSQEPVNIDLPANCFDPKRLAGLDEILQRYPGNAPVRLHFSEGYLDYYLDLPGHKVAWEHRLAKELDAWCAGDEGGDGGVLG